MKLTTKQELLQQEVETRFRCYFFFKRTICHIVILTRKAIMFQAKNMHVCLHTYICKWHRPTAHIPVFSSKNSETITDYVNTVTDNEVWWGWNAQYEVNRLIYGVKQNNGVRATVYMVKMWDNPSDFRLFISGIRRKPYNVLYQVLEVSTNQ